MWINLLLFAAIVFILWSIWTQYNNTPADQSVAKRIGAAILAGLAVAGAAIVQLFHSP